MLLDRIVLWTVEKRRKLSMGSRARKSRRTLVDAELRSSVADKSGEEQLAEMLDNTQLTKIPLEERRKQAEKPLFLTRYE